MLSRLSRSSNKSWSVRCRPLRLESRAGKRAVVAEAIKTLLLVDKRLLSVESNSRVVFSFGDIRRS